MTKIHPVSEKVAVGGQPDLEDLRRLRAQGFAAVVNLRVDGEAEGMPGVAEERQEAAALGLAYHHVPVSLADLDPALVDALQAAIAASPGPVYVHCGAGQRACALALLATSPSPGPADLADTAAGLGLPIVDLRLGRSVRERQAEAAMPILQAV